MIDVGSTAAKQELLEDLQKLNIGFKNIDAIILTHDHYDHVENLEMFKDSKIYSFKNIEELKKDFPEFKVFHLPGHTQEDIVILWEDVLFSGDVIFDKNHNYIGRNDLPESNPEKQKKSLEKLKKIKYEVLCAGHLI